MDSKKLLIIIRYIIITLLLFSIVTYRENNVTINTVMVILLLIVNNQIRFFILNKNTLLIFFSIIAECLLAFMAYKSYGGALIFYFLIPTLDSAFMLKNNLSYIGLTIISLLTVYSSYSHVALNISELLSSLSAIIIIYLLVFYIKEENNKKIKAQELYDKLRISEEKLIKANSDLEEYASSIEELTLLRERNRISREIHDSVGHALSTMIIQLGAIEKVALKDGRIASEMASNLGGFAKGSLQEVRGAVRALKPREFKENQGMLPIEELIKNFQKFTGVEVRLNYAKEKWTLNSEQSFVIYRVIQEFLSNSLKHGKASRVNIFINFTTENIILTMQDNGLGADNIEKGMGLKSIWERVHEIGGEVSYNSKSGEGFLLRVVLF
ncbi:sensor histidine kinase [Clostridium sp. MSJ-11]|uniref:histidine kinase n=1 Tax=Clostridium mobile TaxID=2841512 RepID=A0ABS6EI58_9CLOT|nr:sensor histidine kinase [Clostridium mobile]MBU5484723.1 sensor histidine kinase [Clostridium mobile]